MWVMILKLFSFYADRFDAVYLSMPFMWVMILKQSILAYVQWFQLILTFNALYVGDDFETF